MTGDGFSFSELDRGQKTNSGGPGNRVKELAEHLTDGLTLSPPLFSLSGFDILPFLAAVAT